MNNTLKIGVVSGVSFVVGYFVANWRNEKFYFDRANEEVGETREAYEEKLSEVEKKLTKALNNLRDMGVLADEDDPELARVKKHGRETNAQVDKEIRAASLVMMAAEAPEAAEALSSYQGNGGFVPVDVHAVAEKIQYSSYNTEEAEKQQPREVATENIEIITPDQFAQAEFEYEQPTYVYYRSEDILASGRNDEPGAVDEELRKMLLGSRADLLARETFWENLGDDAFYLRNHDLKLDIEIILADDELKYESPGGNE